MTDRTHPDSGSTHIIRYALELGLLWIDGSGRGKVREALDALDILEAELEAVGAGGVQALSAAPAWKQGSLVTMNQEPYPALGEWFVQFWEGDDVAARVYGNDRDTLSRRCAMLAASPTPPAEQQAAPKAAPVKACVCGEPQAPGTVHRVDGPCYVAAPQQEAQEPVAWQSRTRPVWGDNTRPWSPWEPCTKAQADDYWKAPLLHDWAYEARALYTAPQPAPAPLSDDVVKDAARWRMVALIGNEVMLHPEKRTQAAAVKAYMDATHSGLDLTGAVDAAIAAQGGK